MLIFENMKMCLFRLEVQRILDAPLFIVEIERWGYQS